MSSIQSWLPWTQAPLVLSAPMYGHSNATLAVEVSKASGFGLIPGGFDFSPESKQIDALAKELTLARRLLHLEANPDKPLPVGVGFITCHPSIAHFTETTLPLLQKHKPTAVWLFAPDPAAPRRAHRDIIRALHQVGFKCLVQVGTVAAAREAVEDGADVIVAQGIDAGGHQFARGASVTTLVPEIREMLDFEYEARQIGLVAAGGIVGGRGTAAALALGADGVVLGTRLLVATESSSSESNKRLILESRDGGAATAKSTVFDDIQSTAIWPSLYDGRAIAGDSYNDHVNGLPIEDNVRKFKAAAETGDQSRKIVWCGTGIGLVNVAKPAGVIVSEVRSEAVSALRSAYKNYQ